LGRAGRETGPFCFWGKGKNLNADENGGREERGKEEGKKEN
jgi:hypothetical protein